MALHPGLSLNRLLFADQIPLSPAVGKPAQHRAAMALKVQAPDGVKVSHFIEIRFETMLERAARRPRPMHVALWRRPLPSCITNA